MDDEPLSEDFALRLFLGQSEMMLSRSSMFTPVDLKRRVFQKVSCRAA